MENNNEKYIPDGEWGGFYLYSVKGAKHKMSCFFTFRNGVIIGQGTDDIGNYKWRGTYTQSLEINMKKMYPKHSVNYKGNADENGIWGLWVVMRRTGGYHLWPITQNNNTSESESKNVADKALELSL